MPFIGEIRMFAGNFAPANWQLCDGSLLSVSTNSALFNEIGTTYGGDGTTNFAVPNLRGRIPVHHGNGLTFASGGGVEEVTLTLNQIPSHTHPLTASTNVAQDTNPGGKTVGQPAGGLFPYIQDSTDSDMSPQAIVPAGGTQPHNNLQPYLCINFIISKIGTDPKP